MGLTQIHSRGNKGVKAPKVTVKVHLSGGLPRTHIVGLFQPTEGIETCSRQIQRPPLDRTYVITYDIHMSTLTASEARAKLYRLIDEAAESHEPIRITGKRNNAVLISEEDWSAVQETLFLLSIPGMRESLREGMDTPVEELSPELDW